VGNGRILQPGCARPVEPFPFSRSPRRSARVKSLVVDCAGCGAPLGGGVTSLGSGTLVPCLYCGALLRFTVPTEAPKVEQHIPPELVARAREAALKGGRDEAIRVCIAEGRVTEGAAAAAVDDVIESVANKAVFTQTLSGFGWTLVLASLGLLVLGVVLLQLEPPARWWGLLPLLLGVAHFLLLVRGIFTSIRFFFADRGSGHIVHSVLVGPTGFSDGCQVYSLGIDVTPERGGVSFHARLVLPVRPKSLTSVEAGKTLRVRYDDGGEWLRADHGA
jgi:hypothetical protein